MASEDRFGYEWEKYSEILPQYENQFNNWIYPLTKADLKSDEVIKEKNTILKDVSMIQISSVTRENLNEAVQSIAKLIQFQTYDPEVPAN